MNLEACYLKRMNCIIVVGRWIRLVTFSQMSPNSAVCVMSITTVFVL